MRREVNQHAKSAVCYAVSVASVTRSTRLVEGDVLGI